MTWNSLSLPVVEAFGVRRRLPIGSSAKAVMATLCFFRFRLGFASTATTSSPNHRGFGILAGGIGAVIVSAGLKNKYNVPDYSVDPVGSTVPEANYVWRIILMFGSVPAGLTYYWRMKMPETVGSTRPGLFAKEY
ncbi:hypothetical protein B296_00043024 [Ensete ventricosum]|uniref:Uncharacterized protein n=1 Tax=Ensete ventricosum TaxID=4639 RepID=A0A426Z3E2_ENSVE|nr:hypothetical protein B296_00043024 [Ensete ventricosum]